ncbi:MAG: tol-pal system protein YbgF [Alphaproteobacteria bacterium]
MRRTAISGLVIAGFLAAAGGAAAQSDTRELVNRLERIERDVQIMQRQINRGGPSPVSPSPAPAEESSSPALFQIEQRLAAYDEHLRRLTGQIEELSHQLDQLARKLEKQMGDAEFRLKTIEDARAAPPGAGAQASIVPASPAAGTAAPSQGGTVIIPAPPPGQAGTAAAPGQPARFILPPGSPEDQFRAAFDYLKQNDPQQGERAMRAFIENHPKHALAGNAHFWLGQIHFSAKDFARAAVSFATAYEKFPEGAKAPDSLVRLGNSLAGLNKKEEACAAYKQLSVQYPAAQPALKQSASVEITRLGCK